jgi:hypothetical protein
MTAPKYVWVTKYALTKGILKYAVSYFSGESMVTVHSNMPGQMNDVEHFHGVDWYLDEDNAWKRAQFMREAAIDRLTRQAVARRNKPILVVDCVHTPETDHDI